MKLVIIRKINLDIPIAIFEGLKYGEIELVKTVENG